MIFPDAGQIAAAFRIGKNLVHEMGIFCLGIARFSLFLNCAMRSDLTIFNFEIDESLKENISRVSLLDMMTFDRSVFEKVINTKVKKKVKIKSKYPVVTLDSVCKEIFAGGDLPKNAWNKELTAEFNVPIYSNGTGKRALYGYTNITRVNEDALSISARGTIGHSTLRRAPFYPIVRLIVAIPNTNIVNLYYLNAISSYFNFSKNGKTTPQLTVPMVKPTKLPLPPLDIQQNIVDEIEKIEKETNQNQEKIDTSKKEIIKLLYEIYTLK